MRVFGHRFHGNAANFFQSAAAHHSVGAAEHDRVPSIVAFLNVVVKERVLERHGAVEMQVLFKRIGRVKVMRRLHQGNLLVMHEPADRAC